MALVALATAVLALTVGACSGDEGGGADRADGSATMTVVSPTRAAGPTTTRPTAPPDTAPPVDEPAGEEAAVLAAVDCYWQTIVEANDPPDPDHPGFDRCFTGPALERSRGNVIERQQLRRAVVDPTGVQRSGTTVVLEQATGIVSECFIDDAVTVDSTTGRAIDDSVTTYWVEFRLRKEGMEWKVYDNTNLRSAEGQLCESPLASQS